MRCAKCHRQLKRDPSPDGLGPVCRKNAKPAPTGEGELFPIDIEERVQRARIHVEQFIAEKVAGAQWAIRDAFKAARKALGVTR